MIQRQAGEFGSAREGSAVDWLWGSGSFFAGALLGTTLTMAIRGESGGSVRHTMGEAGQSNLWTGVVGFGIGTTIPLAISLVTPPPILSTIAHERVAYRRRVITVACVGLAVFVVGATVAGTDHQRIVYP